MKRGPGDLFAQLVTWGTEAKEHAQTPRSHSGCVGLCTTSNGSFLLSLSILLLAAGVILLATDRSGHKSCLKMTMLQDHSPAGRDTSVTSQPCITPALTPAVGTSPAVQPPEQGPWVSCCHALTASHPCEQVRDPSPRITDWLRLARNNLV